VHALHLHNRLGAARAFRPPRIVEGVKEKARGGVAMVPRLKAEVQGSPFNVLRSRPATFRHKSCADDVNAEMTALVLREKRARSGEDEDDEDGERAT